MINLAIIGAAGRMGSALISVIEVDEDVTLSCAIEQAASPALGQDAGHIARVGVLDVPIDVSAQGQAFDIMIDFSTPDSTLLNLEHCLHEGKAIVIGTTGMSQEMLKKLHDAAEHIPVMYSSNYSVGVNVTVKLLKIAAAAIGQDTDIEIVEAHHKHKVDAPSGTALMLGSAIADELGKTLANDAVFCRKGIIGEREAGSIGFSTIRGGDIAGEHSVMFIGESERIEITHRASDRMIFAHGAIKAAKWLNDKPSGLYDMNDVLGLN